MADYKEMYLKLFRATTSAIDILQKAQQETEEMYVASTQPELHLMDGKGAFQKSSEKIASEAPMVHFAAEGPYSKK